MQPQMFSQNQQQQQPFMQQQPIMLTPPQVITTKDAMYLKDQMSWLLLAAKKCRHFASECTDQKIGQEIDRIGQMHERHYNLLLKHCQNNNTQIMQTIPQPAQTQ